MGWVDHAIGRRGDSRAGRLSYMAQDTYRTFASARAAAKPPHTLAPAGLFAPFSISLQRQRQQIFNA